MKLYGLVVLFALAMSYIYTYSFGRWIHFSLVQDDLEWLTASPPPAPFEVKVSMTTPEWTPLVIVESPASPIHLPLSMPTPTTTSNIFRWRHSREHTRRCCRPHWSRHQRSPPCRRRPHRWVGQGLPPHQRRGGHGRHHRRKTKTTVAWWMKWPRRSSTRSNVLWTLAVVLVWNWRYGHVSPESWVKLWSPGFWTTLQHKYYIRETRALRWKLLRTLYPLFSYSLLVSIKFEIVRPCRVICVSNIIHIYILLR